MIINTMRKARSLRLLIKKRTPAAQTFDVEERGDERGAALVAAIIILALIAVISVSVFAVISTEANIAGSDLQRTRTFYAAVAGMEKMTSDFSALFSQTARPTYAQLNLIRNSPPAGLTAEGFTFQQELVQDDARLAAMRKTFTPELPANRIPTVNIGTGPFAGLYGSVVPYKFTSTVTQTATGTKVKLERDINNYLIPLFQFGMFTDGDMELHPGPAFTFNGRVHANGNLYVNGSSTTGTSTVFLSKVTTANEFVYEKMRNNQDRASNVTFNVNGTLVNLTKGSVTGGPHFSTTPNTPGYFPDSPSGTYNNGVDNPLNWDVESVLPADGTANRFGGQLITRGTGGVRLNLPFQLERPDGTRMPTREIIKRLLPMDDNPDRQSIKESRYHYKAQIRILIDDEDAGTGMTNQAGIPAGKGELLSSFVPEPLDGGKALLRVSNTGSYLDQYWLQQRKSTAINWSSCYPSAPSTPCNISQIQAAINGNTHPTVQMARTVRGVRIQSTNQAGSPTIGTGASDWTTPSGAGLRGRIYIEIIDTNGVPHDVTKKILSMGMTVGEPNAVVHLQRPMWATFMQGSRDRDENGSSLVDVLNNSRWAADGEINNDSSGFSRNATHGYYSGVAKVPPASTASNNFDDDDRERPSIDDPNKVPVRNFDTTSAQWWNQIVPINVYNPREGRITGALPGDAVYERGVTNVVEINMRNFARWVDGAFDNNLLKGTPAISTNIKDTEGYILYISDRRGDRVRTEAVEGGSINTTNGVVDNEDIYNSNGSLDPGEDVIDAAIDGSTAGNKKGTLQKANLTTRELPDITVFTSTVTITGSSSLADRTTLAKEVSQWDNWDTTVTPNRTKYFRGAVRLFNGENLKVTGTTGKLSETKGITVATENMIYIWGNYNTEGITGQPASGSTLNLFQTNPLNPGANYYRGSQVPTSIIADAFFPLSKTWFDACSALYPNDTSRRLADASTSDITLTTSIRVAIIAGNNISALRGEPDQGMGGTGESRLSGGMHNYPRFLERWGNNQNYNIVGCLIPLFHSTQALGSYGVTEIYNAPKRNWAFDETFRVPDRLPPGTPQFQYVEPTGFRQILTE